MYSPRCGALLAIAGLTTGALNASACSPTMGSRTRHPRPIPLEDCLLWLPEPTTKSAS
jgi:hypothetical protein